MSAGMFAVRAGDIEKGWQDPGTRLLLSWMMEGRDDAPVVQIGCEDACVLEGPPREVVQLVARFMARGVRVYVRDGRRWPLLERVPVLDTSAPDVVVDAEFAAICPPLLQEEREGLRASIAMHGCRDPLVVWKEKGVLLDGHNRREICVELGVRCDVVQYSFLARSEARAWIIDNALSRRNLTRQQRDYLLGKRQIAQRRDKLDNLAPASKPQSEASGKTAEHVAASSAVSRSTVERAAAFATAVDRLGPDTRSAILSGEIRVPRSQVIAAAQAGVRSPEDLRAFTRRPAVVSRDVLGEALRLAAQLHASIEALGPPADAGDEQRLSELRALVRGCDERLREDVARG
jgi:hypothetical protein